MKTIVKTLGAVASVTVGHSASTTGRRNLAPTATRTSANWICDSRRSSGRESIAIRWSSFSYPGGVQHFTREVNHEKA